MSMFPTNILVAIDGSDSLDPALRAAELSEKTGFEVNVIYVGKDVPAPAAYNEPSSSDQEAAQKAQELLDEKARQLEEAGGRIAESYVIPGDDPADGIFEPTKESDIGSWSSAAGGWARCRTPGRTAYPAPWSARPAARY